jgi:tetratricopeptide (TPR) repeat protein
MNGKSYNPKNVAEELAGLIFNKSNDSKRIAELRSALELKSNSSIVAQPDYYGKDRIGIYKPVLVEGKTHYVRDEQVKMFFGIWPKVHTIFPKKENSTRIVFFGESVARGIFYDPHYSPPKVLEEIMKKNCSENIEVIDMAVSSIGPDQILDLCERSVALEPDAYVIFAGNNWKGIGVTEEDLGVIITEASSTKINYKKIEDILENAVSRFVDSFFGRLKKTVTKHNVKLLFIIPEFNLLDYSTSIMQKDISFIDENTKEWLDTRNIAEKKKKEGDYEALKKYSSQLIELNPLHPIGYEWLAHYHYKLGDNQKARELYERARNCAMYSLKRTTPGIQASIRKAMLDSVAKYEISHVNLKDVFITHLNNGIPGRDLFLDYCHLTLEGIEISMKSAANALTKMIWGSEIPPEGLNNYKITSDNGITAAAHFCAALHNAHWGQEFEIVNYHCKKALSYHEEIVPVMKSYLDMITRKAPWIINKETQFLIETDCGKQINGGINIEMEAFKFNDIIFVEAILDSLKEKGIDVYEDLELLRKKEYAIGPEKVNLLQTYYLTSTFDKLIGFNFKEASFYTENGTVTGFHFVCSNQHQALHLDFTYRTPSVYKQPESLILKINGEIFSELPLSKKWKTVKLLIEPHHLKKNLNNLSIEWPIPMITMPENDEKNVEVLSGVLSPPFGQIHSLHMSQVLSFSRN